MEYAEDICSNFTAEITRYMWPTAPKTQDEINKHILFKQKEMMNVEEIALIILEKNSREFLGYANVHKVNSNTPELGIWLKKSAQSHNYAYEALSKLKEWIEDNLNYDYLKYPG